MRHLDPKFRAWHGLSDGKISATDGHASPATNHKILDVFDKYGAFGRSGVEEKTKKVVFDAGAGMGAMLGHIGMYDGNGDDLQLISIGMECVELRQRQFLQTMRDFSKGNSAGVSTRIHHTIRTILSLLSLINFFLFFSTVLSPMLDDARCTRKSYKSLRCSCHDNV
jgi:hypothetical protein